MNHLYSRNSRVIWTHSSKINFYLQRSNRFKRVSKSKRLKEFLPAKSALYNSNMKISAQKETRSIKSERRISFRVTFVLFGNLKKAISNRFPTI